MNFQSWVLQSNPIIADDDPACRTSRPKENNNFVNGPTILLVIKTSIGDLQGVFNNSIVGLFDTLTVLGVSSLVMLVNHFDDSGVGSFADFLQCITHSILLRFR